MANYEITLARSARKQLQGLDRAIGNRVISRIESLAQSPRPAGCVKLETGDRLWRIRVGDYRVIYAIDDERRLVDISAVRHRRDAYR